VEHAASSPVSRPDDTPAAAAPAACPVCGCASLALRAEVETNRRYAIVRCTRCLFVFAEPRPTEQELEAFYSSTYFVRDRPTSLGYADYRTIAEANARRMWRQLRSEVAGTEPRRLLDVGCATGGFLAEARADGWESVGVELSADAVAVARSEFGLDVIHGDLSSPLLEPTSFGLVTMWHVLEHVVDPLASLERARELLAHRGRLLIELPNWNSLGRVLRRSAWSQLKPPEHINFFTPRSLRAAVEKAGMAVVESRTAYPSLLDRAAVLRRTRPLHLAVAVAGRAAGAAGRGGYLRLVAERI